MLFLIGLASSIIVPDTVYALIAADNQSFNLNFRFNSPGARANGMGGAFIGVADDATAAYTNPAGLTILTEPENALVKQHIAMLATEGVTLRFEPAAIATMAELAYKVNRTSQNTGARRLYTISEKLLEEISFHAPDRKGETITISQAMVRETLSDIIKDEDLSKFIL